MFCSKCGKKLDDSAFMCPSCGAPTHNAPKTSHPDASGKDWLLTLLLCLFFGGFGVHSFYVGKVGIGIVQLITLGGCGIWALIDLIFIICERYADGDGKIIYNHS